MKIILIAALTRDLAIGDGTDLLYHISDDLKRFKSLTMGSPVIMGRKTFESFPNGALPGRRNIVITRNKTYNAPGIEVTHSLEKALAVCGSAEKVFIIGGGEIYRQALPLADTLELTLIDAEHPHAKVRFPDIEESRWRMPDVCYDRLDPASGVRYGFVSVNASGIAEEEGQETC